MYARGSPALALFFTLLGPVFAGTDEATPINRTEKLASSVDQTDEEQTRESAQARRIWRAREQHEKELAEKAIRREAALAREREAVRLETTFSNTARRESYLNHERYWLQREVDALPRDPADLSAMARRGAGDRELRDVLSARSTGDTLRQNTLRQLDTLRVR